jgi:hypothetical protein
MEKLRIIAADGPNGSCTGYLKDRPNVVAEGDNTVEMVKNMLNLTRAIKEQEEKEKKEKK